jgi:peptidoglycan hydrolase-like protein with peptidoglycan-binding domain
VTRERLHEYEDGDRESAAPRAAEGTPGKHTLTEQLSRPIIARSVGEGGRNDRRDVGIVQHALARHGHSPGRIDRVVGRRTIAAIRSFQSRLRMKPDGLVEVDRKTERALRQPPSPRPPRDAAPSNEGAMSGQAAPEPAQANAPKGKPEQATSERTSGDPRGLLAALHPAMQSRARALLAEAERRGLSVFVFEGMRSIERQDKLYEQGRTAPGKVVTWVKGGGSYHNYGIAIDVVFQGKRPWGEQHDWNALGACGEAAGLEWGGRWKKADRPHFQIPGLTIAQLKAWHGSGGMQNVWRHVGGNDERTDAKQPVQEDYDDDTTTPSSRGADAPDETNPEGARGANAPAPPRTARKTDDKVLQAVERYAAFIDEAAATYGIDPDQLRAIMAVESRGNPDATSGAAFGLMQITRETWEQTRRTEPALRNYTFEQNWRNPRINTLFGAAVLKAKARAMGVTAADDNFAALAVTAYNAGEGTVKTAIALARDAGSKNPTGDFLRPEFLKPAIAKYNLHSYYLTNATGRKRNKSGTADEALELKYREIVRYAPQVDEYLDKLDARTS